MTYRSCVLLCVFVVACGQDVDLNHASAARASGAFISGNVEPDADCQLKSDRLLSFGTYDVGGGDTTGNCIGAYVMNLLVESMVDELVLFDRAQVTLKASTGDVIVFHSTSAQGTTTDLPNPMMTTIAGRVTREMREGIVGIKAIPTKYAEHISVYSGEEVLVEVKLLGTTPGGLEVSSQPFQFPVAICRGCLSRCMRSFASEKDIAELVGNKCPDNAAADERFCIDPDC